MTTPPSAEQTRTQQVTELFARLTQQLKGDPELMAALLQGDVGATRTVNEKIQQSGSPADVLEEARSILERTLDTLSNQADYRYDAVKNGVEAVIEETTEQVPDMEATQLKDKRKIQREYRELYYRSETNNIYEIANRIKTIAVRAAETGVQPSKNLSDRMYEDILEAYSNELYTPATGSMIMGAMSDIGKGAALGAIVAASKNIIHKPPRAATDKFFRRVAKMGNGFLIDHIIDSTGFTLPEIPEEDEKKLKNWRETVNGVIMICEWDREYDGYILLFPDADTRKLDGDDNLFLISKDPDVAKKVLDAAVELAGKVDAEADSTDNATLLYEQAYNKMISEIIPGSEKNWGPLLEERQQQRAKGVYVTYEKATMERGEGNITNAVGALRERLDNDHVTEAERIRGEAFLKYLEALQTVQTEKASALQGVIGVEEIKAVEDRYNHEIQTLHDQLDNEFPEASSERDAWMKHMLRQGLLRIEPYVNKDFGDHTWEYRVRPNLDPELTKERKELLQKKKVSDEKNNETFTVVDQSRLDEINGLLKPAREAIRSEAISKAIAKQNSKLYAITNEERNLPPRQWKEFAMRKRAAIVQVIKDKIDQKLRLTAQSGKNNFNDIFKGLFEGENEFTLEKLEIGETVPNAEFIKEIFNDREYIRGLLYIVDSDKFLGRFGDRNYDGRVAIRQLVDIYRQHYPGETDVVVGNLVDSLMQEQKQYNEGREREESVRFEKRARTFDELEGVDRQSPETDYFHEIAVVFNTLGIAMSYHELESVQQASRTDGLQSYIDRINPVAILERSYGITSEDPVTKMYVDMYRSLFGDTAFVDRITSTVFFPSIRTDDLDKRRMYRNRDISNTEDHVARAALDILKKNGLIDFQAFQKMLVDVERSLDDPSGVGRDAQFDGRRELRSVRELGINITFKAEADRAMGAGLDLGVVANVAGMSIEELLSALKDPRMIEELRQVKK